MLQHTHPATAAAGGSPEDRADFRVRHTVEQLALLRQLRDRQAPVHLHAPGGAALSTRLWAVHPEHARLSFSAEAADPHIGRLLDAEEWVAVAYLERVKLQFDLGALVLVRGVDSCALQTDLPREIYRFQRRQAYRVDAIERSAPQALLRHPSIPEMQLALRVLDVSAGGCALWLPQDVPPLQAGTELGEVRIVLDATTRFAASLTLQHVTNLGVCEDSGTGGDLDGDTGAGTAPHGRGVRLGCAWRPLGGAAERNLQRWIDQAQKRQRLLSLQA